MSIELSEHDFTQVTVNGVQFVNKTDLIIWFYKCANEPSNAEFRAVFLKMAEQFSTAKPGPI